MGPKLQDIGQWNDKNVTYRDIQNASSSFMDKYQLESKIQKSRIRRLSII